MEWKVLFVVVIVVCYISRMKCHACFQEDFASFALVSGGTMSFRKRFEERSGTASIESRVQRGAVLFFRAGAAPQ